MKEGTSIPPPPKRTPPAIPHHHQQSEEFSSRLSPVPSRKQKTPIPNINFIEATPSPILKRNHNEMFESDTIDELNIVSNSTTNKNSRKRGVISDKINDKETISIEIPVFLKDKG